MIRLSVARDASTSPERQREHCRQTIDVRGGVEVGVAEDLAVSAFKYGPFDRPGLGPWLTDPDKLSEWDALVVWRLDRLVRSSKDLADLLTWCQEHDKGFVSATEGFDLSSPFGRAMVAIIAALGQLEAETTRERVADSHAYLRTVDRWPSGSPPLGFQVVPHPSGKGKGLATDPDGKRLLHEMAAKLIEGWSINRIAQWCNDSGQLTSYDRVRVAKGQPPRKAPWTASNVRRVLTAPNTQGWKTTLNGSRAYGAGDLVLNEHGEPIRMAPATFDDTTWEQIQLAVAARSRNGKRRTRSPNPLLGIGVCGSCGASLAQLVSTKRGKTYRYYLCGRTPVRCTGVSTPAAPLDAIFEEAFLLAHRGEPIRERVFVPGTDNRAEIEQAREIIGSLTATMAIARSATARGALSEQLAAADARLTELEKEPYRPSRWDVREGEQTYGDVWAGATLEQRRKLLQDAGARVTLYSRDHADIRLGAPGSQDG